MMNNVNERLIEDADIMAEVAASLGRLGPDQKLISLVAEAKSLRKDAQMDLAPEQEAALRAELNTTLTALSPITLGDLRQGWRPFDRNWRQKRRFLFVMILCVIVVIVVGHYTLVYEKASSVLTSLKEMQAYNEYDAVSSVYFSLNSLKKSEDFQKIYSDSRNGIFSIRQNIMERDAYKKILDNINSSLFLVDLAENFITMTPSAVLRMLDGSLPPELSFCKNGGASGRWCKLASSSERGTTSAEFQPASVHKVLSCDALKGPGTGGTPVADASPQQPQAPPDPSQASGKSPQCLLKEQAEQVVLIMNSLGVDYNPKADRNYLPDIFHLKSNVDVLGKWVLPALYGVFGAMLFFMRHYVDPAVPSPPLAKLFHTLTLGGIAGVIVVWFWTPTPPTPNTIQVTSLGAFVVAFLVGFSTDVVFGMLDRFSKGLSDTLGKQGA